ncbi:MULTISPECIES: DNA-binding transcriptional regulator DsdC [Pasteurellaceae]|uniref:DNA-binding transcriptional regulator DsdC n=1 Tax=Pasteurellaceae TaxID=712 RepID=UPI00356A354B
MYSIERNLVKNRRLDRYQFAKLHTFETCARHLSFAIAAEELCITPSAVSHQISRLEHELGFQLFKRYHRRIELTYEGKKLFHTLQQSFDMLNKEIFDIRHQEISGELIIYARPSLAQSWLVPQLAGFAQKYPYITLNMLTGNETINFERYKVDLAIYYDDLYDEKLHHYKLMSESIIPVCSPDYAQKYSLHQNTDSLKKCTLLHDGQAWSNHSDFEEWQSWFEYFQLPFKVTDIPSMMFDRSDLALTAAIHHMGIAMGRKHLIEPYLPTHQLIMPFPQLEKRCQQCYYIVTPYMNSPKINAFITWLKNTSSFIN